MVNPLPNKSADDASRSGISDQSQIGSSQPHLPTADFHDKKSEPLVSGKSATSKEREPVSAERPEAKIEAVPEPEVAISQEAREAGIEMRPETPEIPPDLKKIGVAPAGPAQPVVHQGSDKTGKPAAAVTLPISDDQVVAGLHASVVSSLRWLAEWCRRRLRQAHLTLRKVHGKVMRLRRE